MNEVEHTTTAQRSITSEVVRDGSPMVC